MTVTEEQVRAAFDEVTAKFYTDHEARDRRIMLRQAGRDGIEIYFRFMGHTYRSLNTTYRALRAKSVRNSRDQFDFENRLYSSLYREDEDDRAARLADERE
jgi:histone acetyltransferase (RNA polymerase elongator complex component)